MTPMNNSRNTAIEAWIWLWKPRLGRPVRVVEPTGASLNEPMTYHVHLWHTKQYH